MRSHMLSGSTSSEPGDELAHGAREFIGRDAVKPDRLADASGQPLSHLIAGEHFGTADDIAAIPRPWES